MPIPLMGGPRKSKCKNFTHCKACCSLKSHPRAVTLQMFCWISATIIEVKMWHHEIWRSGAQKISSVNEGSTSSKSIDYLDACTSWISFNCFFNCWISSSTLFKDFFSCITSSSSYARLHLASKECRKSCLRLTCTSECEFWDWLTFFLWATLWACETPRDTLELS